MKEKGKAVETNNNLPDSYYSSTDQISCKKHPSSSSVGICAYCLNERLIKLVCTDCGEQRLSSCSCSDFSSNRNSSATDIGSVGRISFLIENESSERKDRSCSKFITGLKPEVGFVLKRSSSTCGVKRRGGIWRIVRLFRKKREKGGSEERRSADDKNEGWVFYYLGVSRSRSLCSFRGGSFPEESSVSDYNRNSALDSERPSGPSETEPGKSGFKESDCALNATKKSVFPVKETDFCFPDDSGFIDLKRDLGTESKREYSVSKSSDFPVSVANFCGAFQGHHEIDEILRNVGSCRIAVSEKGIKKAKRGHTGWRWIFRFTSQLDKCKSEG